MLRTCRATPTSWYEFPENNRTTTEVWRSATCRGIPETVVWSLGRGLQRSICLEMHLALVMCIRHVHLSPPRLPEQGIVVVSLSTFAILHDSRWGKKDGVALRHASRRRWMSFDASRPTKQRCTHRSQLTIDNLKLTCVASVRSLTLKDYVPAVDPS